ncbi:unnamed protein product [Zymoseptoria tritici ST99CH_1E4]|uniref:Uncharacterized protein n=1 Tax=Zymoseptoria tritici ST99CH_1E4 TaxID=1276532 RepID=A0A2H1GIP2_ZYMTR|nr:unnamed protein product [Zymoseptoria tritici ST99CH_1E4]
MSLLGLKAIRSTTCGSRLGISSTTARQGLYGIRLQPIQPGPPPVSTFSTTRTVLSSQRNQFWHAKKRAWASSTFKQESTFLEKRLNNARKTIKDPGRLEREITRIRAEVEVLSVVKNMFRNRVIRETGGPTAGLKGYDGDLVRAIGYFMRVCLRGPLHGVHRYTWYAVLMWLSVPVGLVGAVYFTVSTVSHVLQIAFGG